MESDLASDIRSKASLLNCMPPRWVLLSLVLVVLVVRGQFMLKMHGSLEDDPDQYRAIANYLHDRHTFAMEWTGLPTAYRPPLYPFILAAFQYLPEHALACGVFHVALGTATACLVWRLGLLWGLPPLASLAAAGLVAIDPILLNQSVLVMTETLAAFLAAWTLVALPRAANHNSLLRAAAAGALLGLCVLCRPTFAAWFALVVVAWPVAITPRRVARGAALVVAAALVLAPWTIRNARVLGWPVVTTTHGGYTLALGNNPAFYRWLREGEWGSTWQGTEFSRPLFLQLIGTHNEVERDRETYRIAFENIRNEPGTFAYACLVRVGRLWGVLPHQLGLDESPSRRGLRYSVAIFYTFELLLAAVGAWQWRARLWSSPIVWATLLVVSFTAVHALYWTDLRMRAPLVSVVALLASAGVASLLSRKHDASALPAAG